MDSFQSQRLKALTPLERAYVRRELDMFFSTLPRVSDGFPLKSWRSGAHAGKPKIPTAATDMVARGLLASTRQRGRRGICSLKWASLHCAK